MPVEPDTLGKGIGPLLSDYMPLLPSGARRAGAARVMADRIGKETSWVLRNPLKAQIIASGIGGATIPLTDGLPNLARGGIAAVPFLLLQGLKRREIKKIQEEYDEKDRKRLRELDTDRLFDAGTLGLGGSSRLGAIQAYETMRDRKFKNLSSLAELGDVIHLGTSAALSPYAAIPITSAIDNMEADRLSKAASFYDQQNNPALPLYLAAAGLSGLGSIGASALAKHEMGNTDPLGTWRWGGLIRDISGTNPMLFSSEGMNNGYFYKPRTIGAAESFLAQHRGSGVPLTQGSIRRLLSDGAIVADSDAGAPLIAHEAGHAKIEANPGVMRVLQRHLYPHRKWLSPLAGAGSMAAGLHSGSTLKGALLGTGIGALAGIGTVAPEVGASYHALKHLHSKGDGKMTAEGWKDLLSAISTYLAGTVLPSTLAGAAGGHLGAKRRKREEEREKEASEDYVLSETDDPDEDDEVAEKQQRQRIDAHIDGQNAGFVTYHPDSEDPEGGTWVQGLYVRPEDRGKGLARRLMQAVEKKNKGKRMGLRARPFKDESVSAEDLVKIYQKLGYEVGDEDNRMYKEPVVEKQANFKTVADVLRRARQLRATGFLDSADHMTMEHLGKAYSAAKKMPDGPLSGLTQTGSPVPKEDALRMLQDIKDSITKQGHVTKQANKFSQLWRAGKLSADSIRRATGVSRAAVKPRSAEKFDETLRSMRRRRGDVDALNKWMPAAETYDRLLPKELARRFAAMRGADPRSFDMSGMGSWGKYGVKPKWVGGDKTLPKFTQEAASNSGRLSNYEKAQGLLDTSWDPVRKQHYYYDSVANKVLAPRATPTARHEMGHWAFEKKRITNPIAAALESRQTLKALEDVDPRLMRAIVSRNTPGYNSSNRNLLLEELQGHLAGARGTGVGAQRLRASTAVDNPFSRSTFYRKSPKLGEGQRAGLLGWRREQDDTLKEIRSLFAGKDPNSGLLSSLEHLVKNYHLRLPGG